MKDLRFMRVFTILISLTILLGLTGCGISKPEPYKVKIQQTKSDLTFKEKTLLLNKVVRDLSRKTKSQGGNYGCILTWDRGYKDKDCYVLKGKNIERVTKINGLPRIHKTSLKYIEKRLQPRFEAELLKYQKYANDFKKAEEGLKLKLSTMKVSLDDSTKILPNDIFEKMNKISVRRYSPSAASCFNSYRRNKKIENLFNIETVARYNGSGRYKIELTEQRFLETYKIAPDDRKIEIKRLKYNYLPAKFIANDKNIKVVVTNNILGKLSIQSILVQNNTTEFIELNAIAGYYGGDVTINILNNKTNKIKIPPMSNITLAVDRNDNHALNDFPVKKYLYTTSRKHKISYGFSVAYTMVNQNANKNIYKVTDYTINKIESKEETK